MKMNEVEMPVLKDMIKECMREVMMESEETEEDSELSEEQEAIVAILPEKK